MSGDVVRGGPAGSIEVLGSVSSTVSRWAAMDAARRGVDLVVVEGEVESLRGSLLGGGRSVVEQLLAERVIATWLALEVVERAFLSVLERPHGRSESMHADVRLSRAQGRFLASCRTLAAVRRVELRVVLASVGS